MGEAEHTKTIFLFRFIAWMQALTIQLQESSPTLNKMSEVKLKRDKRSLIVSVMLFPTRRYRGCLSSLTLRANRRNLVDH